MHLLLENISLLTRHLQNPVSAETLNALTPKDNRGDLNYRGLVDVLQQQGFTNYLQQRPLNSIPSLAMPVVLLLKDQESVILNKVEGDTATIEIAETGVQEIPIDELKQRYLGYVWFIKGKLTSDIRSELPEYQLSKGWFWKIIWRFRRYYYQVILTTLIINVLALVSSLYVMNVYDRVIPNKSYDTLWVLSIGVFIAIGFEFIAKIIRGRLTDIAGKKADLIISSALFRRVMQIKMVNKPVSAGSYANNLRDFESVREFMTSASLLAIIDMPFFLLFISVMYLVAGKLALIPLFIVAAVTLVGLIAQVPLAKSINESMRESSQRQGLAVEAIEGVETLKVNNAYSWVQKRWDHYTARSAYSNIKTKNISNIVSSLSAMLTQLNTVMLILAGTYLIHAENISDRITMGALIACVILSGRALGPMGQISGLAIRYQQAKVALSGVNEIAQRPIEYSTDRKYITLDNPRGEISFKDCDFVYEDGGKPALEKLSAHINAGEKVAILGRIGSGKSTLLKIAASLYEQQSGIVTFDGVDLRQIDPFYLRNKVALLGQNPRLFLGTLRDNLDMARSDGFFSDEVLLNSLKRFGVHQIIQQHPQGLDMPIGEGGAGLSGGQQQIVSLARLTLKDPSVVLLDEPTSGLDQNTEKQVLFALKQWMKNRTMVVVTHRPQLLALVDRIIVIENGKVAMDGPKKQVLDELAKLNQPQQPAKPAPNQKVTNKKQVSQQATTEKKLVNQEAKVKQPSQTTTDAAQSGKGHDEKPASNQGKE